MGTLFLPHNLVVTEARTYRSAALLLERHSAAGNTDLFWPAAMNAALAVEIYLKSFLVEQDYPDIRLSKPARKARHDLSQLYDAIPTSLRAVIEAANSLLAPPLRLDEMFEFYADYFAKVRYSYEQDARRTIRSELFVLMDRMENICTSLAPAVELPSR
ncbi:hypothetical protein [Stutzerimonas kunmingensis]|uniref:hypothetical protein n=1 Tax=Stutzerimonas kunmingensis TaxID=1211807 RepID=UPI00241DF512|nr:hypothetical protein [Stutzerimonas kunmingensis]